MALMGQIRLLTEFSPVNKTSDYETFLQHLFTLLCPRAAARGSPCVGGGQCLAPSWMMEVWTGLGPAVGRETELAILGGRMDTHTPSTVQATLEELL